MQYNLGNIDKVSGSSLGSGDLVTDAWGIQKVSLPRTLFHGMWTYDIPASMWFMYENGTQVYTSTNIISENGVAKLSSTGKTSVLLESRECPRYQPNRGHLFSTALWLPSKTLSAKRDFGLFTTENGVFFRLKSDGKLYAVIRRGSVEVLEQEINTSSLIGFDVQKNNIYDIQFQWRSAGNYHFYIGNPATGTSTLVHSVLFLGTLTSASIENPALPAAFKITKVSDDSTMYVGCADITSENGLVDVEQYSSCYSTSVSVNGTDKPVIVAHNPLLINSKTNTRTVTLARISVNCSKRGVFRVWTGRNSAAITGATLKDIGYGSFMQSDSPEIDPTAVRATAITTTNLRPVTSIAAEAALRISVDNPYRSRIEFPLVRGDYLIVTCSASTATADCIIEFGEQV